MNSWTDPVSKDMPVENENPQSQMKTFGDSIPSNELDYKAMHKAEEKRHRQQLKLECLSMALHDDTTENVVKRAKEYYNFVRT